jgi:hypothetical protein
MVLPTAWSLTTKVVDRWWWASIVNDAGQVQWSGEHPDPKILFLDALGWLSVRDHKVKHPVWKQREHEVPLYKAPITAVSSSPDPEDLDPVEVEAVYRTSR